MINKVFLDPHTKYSDQYAMLAKIPGIVNAVNENADALEQIEDIVLPDPSQVPEGSILTSGEDGKPVYIPADEVSVGHAKLADNLDSNVSTEDKVPYIFRTAGGSADIGEREFDSIVGGSVVWNQLISNTSEATGTAGQNNTLNVGTFTAVSGHKYLASYRQKSTLTSNTRNVALLQWSDDTRTYFPGTNENAHLTAGVYSAIISCTVAGSTSLRIWSNNPNQDVTYGDYQVIDLTQMFGSTIADYIYTLETATAGAGVAWFKKLFPKNYYPYDAGTLKHVEGLSAHKMVGFNAYNDGSAKLVGGMEYQITGAYTALSFEGETITPDSSGYFTPSVNGTLTVTGGGDNTCVHLVWDGERDGEYEPYKEMSYPLDESLILRGVPKLDANNALYYDGDLYEADGTVTRKWELKTFDGSVDVNTWFSHDENYNTWGYYMNVPTQLNVALDQMRSEKFNFVSAVYAADVPWTMSANITSGQNGYIAFRIPKSIIETPTSALDLASKIKAWMSENPYVVLIKKSNPTTEEAEPYEAEQWVDNFGTEEYVTTGIPVGHDTRYPVNLKAKLEMLPNSPDGDGDYIMRQSNGMNAFIPYADVKELPDMPTENGTYVLQAVKTSSGVTLSWVSAT